MYVSMSYAKGLSEDVLRWGIGDGKPVLLAVRTEHLVTTKPMCFLATIAGHMSSFRPRQREREQASTIMRQQCGG